MSMLPYLGETVDTGDWTDAEIVSYTLLTYLIVCLFLASIGIAVHNFIKFVVRGGKCRVLHPLFGFYILIILTMVSDIIYSFLLVRLYQDEMPFILYMPPTFKFLSGIEQIWMMIELTLHLKMEISSHTG